MESKEIIGRFLSAGYSLDSASLDFFAENSSQVDAFLTAAKTLEDDDMAKRPAIVTLGYVQKILESQPGPGCGRFVVLKEFDRKERNLSVEDVVSNRLKEYEEAKKILSEKLDDVVSINKMQRQHRFSLVVGVLEKAGSDSVVVEDVTGSATLRFENRKEFDDVVEGDYIGVACEPSADGPTVKSVVWPDIPLKRKVESPRTSVICVLVFGADQRAAGFEARSFDGFVKWLNENAGRNPHVVAFSDPEHAGDTDELFRKAHPGLCVSVVPVPSLVEIDGVKIIACESESLGAYRHVWGNELEIMINLLKRRALPLEKRFKCGVSAGHASFFDTVPDVFVSTGSKEPSASNYKGTNVISIGSFSGTPTFFAIDLKTRDVNKVDLS